MTEAFLGVDESPFNRCFSGARPPMKRVFHAFAQIFLVENHQKYESVAPTVRRSANQSSIARPKTGGTPIKSPFSSLWHFETSPRQLDFNRVNVRLNN